MNKLKILISIIVLIFIMILIPISYIGIFYGKFSIYINSNSNWMKVTGYGITNNSRHMKFIELIDGWINKDYTVFYFRRSIDPNLVPNEIIDESRKMMSMDDYNRNKTLVFYSLAKGYSPYWTDSYDVNSLQGDMAISVSSSYK